MSQTTAELTVGRRGLLLGAGATLTLGSGCALNNPFGAAKDSADGSGEEQTPDVALAVTAVGAILAAQARARLTVETYPGLGSRFNALIELHVAHVDALAEAVPAGTIPSTVSTTGLTVPSNRGAALKQQERAERALRDRLVAMALRSESGPFARLLGSMAAAISQQLADLSRRDAA